MYEQSFRSHREMSALTDYFTGETYSYYGLAKEIAKVHILLDEAGIKPKDKIALVGRNTPRWCVVYLATITYGAVIVPILQDFTPNDITHIVNHSESKLLFQLLPIFQTHSLKSAGGESIQHQFPDIFLVLYTINHKTSTSLCIPVMENSTHSAMLVA